MRDKAAACIFLDRLRFRSRRAFLGYIRGRVQAGCLYIFSVGWQGSSRGGEDSCRRKQLLIRLSIGDCNSNLNWRSRVCATSAAAAAAARYETSLPPSIFNPEDLDGPGANPLKVKASRLHLPFLAVSDAFSFLLSTLLFPRLPHPVGPFFSPPFALFFHAPPYDSFETSAG